MAFVVDKPKQLYTSGPMLEEGFNDVVVAEVKDLGMEPVNPVFLDQKKKEMAAKGQDPSKAATHVRKCLFIYRDAAGNEANEKLTVSLHEKATLSKRVKSIIGEEPTDTFDLDSLVGAQVVVQIEHQKSQRGNLFAKVAAVARKKGATKIAIVPAKVAAPASAAISTAELGL